MTQNIYVIVTTNVNLHAVNTWIYVYICHSV